MYEVNLHVTLLSVTNGRTNVLGRKVRGCKPVGMLIQEKKASVTRRLSCFKQDPFCRKEPRFLLFFVFYRSFNKGERKLSC